MKIVNGILSVVLGALALYLMFINAKTNQDFILGFGVMLTSIIFMLFMIIEERNEDIERLRRIIRYTDKVGK
jgi:hypothetical protein